MDYYAASQVMDEARHVEVYHRYLSEKMGIAYPVAPLDGKADRRLEAQARPGP